MPLDFSIIKTNLYNWAVANVPSGMPVVWYFPNAPRPTVDYVTLLITTVNQIAWDYVPQPIDDGGVVEQVGDREFIVQAQAYGGNPLTILEGLRTSLQKQTVLDSLSANGIVLADWFGINDITDLVDSRFEQRAQVDILFRIATEYTDNLGAIEQVEAEEVIFNVDGNIVIDQTLTIPPNP